MTQAISQLSLTRLKRYLADYRPQLEKALTAIQTLETPGVDEESFSQALADLHVCATVLEAYSEGMVDAIDQFTEGLPS
jgi:hypothetical protein